MIFLPIYVTAKAMRTVPLRKLAKLPVELEIRLSPVE